MQTMYSLLAMPAWFTENAKWFAIGAAVLIVILALVAGFSMGWGPLTWAGGLRALRRVGTSFPR